MCKKVKHHHAKKNQLNFENFRIWKKNHFSFFPFFSSFFIFSTFFQLLFHSIQSKNQTAAHAFIHDLQLALN